MKTQEQFLQEILDLKRKHPGYEIHFCVDGSEISEHHPWTDHRISRVDVQPWFYHDDDTILIDEDDIKESMEDCNHRLGYNDEMLIDEEYRIVKRVICVFTEAYKGRI